MIIYKRSINGERTTYFKNNLLTSINRIPQQVLDNFEFSDEVKFDDQPEKPRCLFCDAPGVRQKLVNIIAHGVELMTVELCDYHYYNRNLGKIVERVRLNNQEQERKENGSVPKVSKRRKSKRKQSKVSKPQTKR